MPKLKGITFETAIIERYRRRESSVEEALIEMYLAGVLLLSIKNVQKRRRNLSRLISTMILNFMGGKVRAVSGGD